MYAFEYHRPTSVEDAAALLARTDDPKIVAGGQTLLPTMKQRLASPSDLIDLNGIAALSEIKEDGNLLVIGAMARHDAVCSSPIVKAAIPAIASLAEHIGDPQVRNRGTIGGSVANNDPAADYPGAVLALNATVHTTKRHIPADEFFAGMFTTALEDDEIITAIAFPKPEKAAYVKFPNPASRYAVVGAFVAKTADGVRVAITGAGEDGVFRLTRAEEALTANFSADAVAGLSVPADGLNGDIHASAEYRAHLIGVMVKRAVAACA